MVMLLLVGLGGTGYAYLVQHRCSGETVITVASAPDHFAILSSLGDRWSAGKPNVAGRCARINVVRQDSVAVADALSPAWDERRDGDRPDVWAPEATTWVRLAQGRADAAAMLPARSPSLGRTPLVIAMPQPMAEALGWPDRQRGWLDLFTRLKDPRGWASTGHPEWGPMRVGIADPGRDTAALGAVLSVVNNDGDLALSDDELAAALDLERSIATFATSTMDLVDGLARADAAGRPMTYLSAFPATEQQVSSYNATAHRVPLAAVYPPEGAPSADHPYVVLAAPWVNGLHRAVAARFLQYLRGSVGRRAYIDAGFRLPDAAATSLITEARGLMPAAFTERPVLGADLLVQVVGTWTALRRQGNILGVLDTSSSMGQRVAAGRTKLQIAQQAVLAILDLLKPDSTLGLWAFPAPSPGSTEHEELVPLGEVATNRHRLATAVLGLVPDGKAALFDTTLAAYKKVRAAWKPGELNLVFLLTDGGNEVHRGISREQLLVGLAALRDPSRPVQFISVAYGTAADTASLRMISGVVGGRMYLSTDPADLRTVLLSAIVGANARPG